MRPHKIFAVCALTALLATGCAAYHFGPVNNIAAGEKSIEVLPFNNQTLQPRLGDAVTQALREQLQTDATYRLTTQGHADVVVSGVIKSYTRRGLSYLNNDVSTTENYRVNVVVHVIARESNTGKVLLDRDVKGYTLIHVGGDLADAERQASPLLAEDLAESITELLTEGSW
jgi:Lipopolysaccharide-assembly